MASESLSGRITFVAAADEFNDPVRIKGAIWTGATATHVLLVDDADGKEIFGAVAETDGTQIHFWFGEQGIPVDDIVVTTMGSGRLVVYV